MTNSAGKGERRRPHPPFAQPDPGRRAMPATAASAEAAPPPAMPSIDEFVDDLPLIDEFLMEAEVAPALPYAPSRAIAPSTALETDEEGWAAADWQSYDWSRIASLGAPAPEAVEAHAAWSSTDWDSAARGLPAHEVAAALDEIARRIRSGELSLERFHGTPPEAAIAAVFAALLRTKG
jgi:hypothetical protein